MFLFPAYCLYLGIDVRQAHGGMCVHSVSGLSCKVCVIFIRVVIVCSQGKPLTRTFAFAHKAVSPAVLHGAWHLTCLAPFPAAVPCKKAVKETLLLTIEAANSYLS